jgi:hypothetical protein
MWRDQFPSGMLHIGELLGKVRRREKMDARLSKPAGNYKRKHAPRIRYAFYKFQCLLQFRSPYLTNRYVGVAVSRHGGLQAKHFFPVILSQSPRSGRSKLS